MYSRSSEPVRFERDCAAVLVPQGDQVTLPAGTVGYITQSLGGSWTVFVEGNLMRIAGNDADAIGKQPPESIELRLGPAYAWELIRLANGPVQLGWYALALVVAVFGGLSGRRPAPSVR